MIENFSSLGLSDYLVQVLDQQQITSPTPIQASAIPALLSGKNILGLASTGSGKTLTSFKAARLATQLDFIDKVFFVVDRKDLDFQTMKEYQRFSPDSVNGSDSTAGLKRNIEKRCLFNRV